MPTLDEIKSFIQSLPGTVQVVVNLQVNTSSGNSQPQPSEPDGGNGAEYPKYRVDTTVDPNKKNDRVKVRSNPDPTSSEFAYVFNGDIVTGTGLTFKAFTQIYLLTGGTGWVETLYLAAM